MSRYAIIDDPRWNDLPPEDKKGMLDVTFSEQISSDSRWEALSKEDQGLMRNAYSQDAQEYENSIYGQAQAPEGTDPFYIAYPKAVATIPLDIISAGGGLLQRVGETHKHKQQEVIDAIETIGRKGAPKPLLPQEDEVRRIAGIPGPERPEGVVPWLLEDLGEGVKKTGDVIRKVRDSKPGRFIANRAAQARIAKAVLFGEIGEGGKLKEATPAEKFIGEQGLAKSGKAIAKTFKSLADKTRPKTKYGSLLYYGTTAVESVGSTLGTSVLVTLATKNPMLGFSTMFPRVYGQSYAEDRAAGRSTTESANRAFYNATTEIVTEIGPFGIFTTGGKLIARVVKGMSAEAIQEVVNEAMQIAYDEGVVGEDTPPEEIGRRLFDAGIIGGLGGVGMSVLTHGPANRADRETANKDRKLSGDIRDSLLEHLDEKDTFTDNDNLSAIERTNAGFNFSMRKEDAIQSLQRAVQNNLLQEADIAEIIKKHPELQDTINAGKEAYDFKKQTLAMLKEGMETGLTPQGETFSEEMAVSFLAHGFKEGYLDDSTLENIKNTWPELTGGVDAILEIGATEGEDVSGLDVVDVDITKATDFAVPAPDAPKPDLIKQSAIERQKKIRGTYLPAEEEVDKIALVKRQEEEKLEKKLAQLLHERKFNLPADRTRIKEMKETSVSVPMDIDIKSEKPEDKHKVEAAFGFIDRATEKLGGKLEITLVDANGLPIKPADIRGYSREKIESAGDKQARIKQEKKEADALAIRKKLISVKDKIKIKKLSEGSLDLPADIDFEIADLEDRYKINIPRDAISKATKKLGGKESIDIVDEYGQPIKPADVKTISEGEKRNYAAEFMSEEIKKLGEKERTEVEEKEAFLTWDKKSKNAYWKPTLTEDQMFEVWRQLSNVPNVKPFIVAEKPRIQTEKQKIIKEIERTILKRLNIWNPETSNFRDSNLAHSLTVLQNKLDVAEKAENRGGVKTAPVRDEVTPTEIPKPKPAEPVVDDIADEGIGGEVAEFNVEQIKDIETQKIPLDQIKHSKDVPQFKEGADEKGVVEALSGIYQRVGTPPIVLWERKNGDLELVTGRHRFDLAQRQQEETIPAQVLKESDGFTKEHAAIFDAESNIRDEKGSVRDYATYFRETNITEKQASGRGLLSRAKGKDGFVIGNYAANDLYGAYRNQKLNTKKTIAIAKAVPNNNELQNIGMKYADSNTAENTANYLHAIKTISPMASAGQQIGLFGEDESWQIEADKMAKTATLMKKELSQERLALKAANNLNKNKFKEFIKRYKINPGDTNAIAKRIKKLDSEIVKVDNWASYPDVVAKVKKRAGILEKSDTAAKAEPVMPKKETPTPTEPATIKTATVKEKVELSEQKDDKKFSTKEDYVGTHGAPDEDFGAPAHDLTNFFPDDIYSPKGYHYYGHGGGPAGVAMDKKSIRIISSLRGKPDKKVTIYRAVPKNIKEINPGDWVTINKEYAKSHGESNLSNGYEIIKKIVKASEIFTNGDSIHEWGYVPVGSDKKLSTKATKPQDTITKKDLKQIFSDMKNIVTSQDKDGNFWFKVAGRPKVTIFEVNEIDGYIQTSAGQIPVGSFLKNTIELKTGGKGVTADTSTAFHEFTHWIEENHILTENDTTALNKEIAKIKGISESGVTEEYRADFVGDNLAEWRGYRNLRIRRILKKIADFMNAVYEFVARTRTARGVLRDVESGGIFSEREGFAAPVKTTIPVFQQTADRFYSQVIKTVQDKMPAKMQVSSVMNWLRKQPGVKAAELEWMDIESMLEGKKAVTKDELVSLLKENQVIVEEVEKSEDVFYTEKDLDYQGIEKQGTVSFHIFKVPGNVLQLPVSKYKTKKEAKAYALTKIKKYDTTKFSEYQLDGEKENYREFLFKLPGQNILTSKEQKEFNKLEEYRIEGQVPVEKVGRYNELAEKAYQTRQTAFKSGHWPDDTNTFAHARVSERTDADGNKVLFIEEIQSDWALKGRKEGYVLSRAEKAEIDKMAGEEYIPLSEAEQVRMKTLSKRMLANVSQMPFKKNWHEVVLKRIIRMAAEQGIDNVAWVTGKQTADRYDLSKHLSEVHYVRTDLTAYDHDGETAIKLTGILPEELPTHIGKELAQKLMDVKPVNRRRSLTGLDLKVGGNWAFNLYDRMIPQFLKKFGKKYKAEVGITEINGLTQQSFTITPELKKAALFEGMPLFQMAGKKAIGADKGALAKAQKMLADGVDKKVVWKETGWLKGTEKEDTWKFEIDDSGARWTPGFIADIKTRLGKTLKLKNVFKHPVLYKAYPELKDVNFVLTNLPSGDNAVYAPKTNTITLNSTQAVDIEKVGDVQHATVSTLLHEVQHYIQEVENFARGGSPERMRAGTWIMSEKDRLNLINEVSYLKKAIDIFKEAETQKITVKQVLNKETERWGFDPLHSRVKEFLDIFKEAETKKEIVKLWEQEKTKLEEYEKAVYDTPFEQYQKIAGEIEARDSSDRAKLTPKQRREQMPYESQGIPEDQWIVLDGDGTSFNIEKTEPTKKFSVKDDSDSNQSAQEWADKAFKDMVASVKKTKSEDVDDKTQKTSEKRKSEIHKEISINTLRFIDDFMKAGKHVEFKKGRPDFKRIENLVASPEFQFKRIPAADRVLEAAHTRRDDTYELQRELLKKTSDERLMLPLKNLEKNNPAEHEKLVEFVTKSKKGLSLKALRAANFSFEAREAWHSWNRKVVTKDFRENDDLMDPFRKLRGNWLVGRLQKSNVEYRRLQKVILKADINRRPITVEYLQGRGFSDLAIKSWIGRQEQVNLGLDMLIDEIRAEIIAYERIGESPPPIVKVVDGKKIKIDLIEALKVMGDMRDYYSPRNRNAGRFQVYIKNKNGHDVYFFSDMLMVPLKRYVGVKYPASKGYEKATITKSQNLSEDVFENQKKVVDTQQIVNDALGSMTKQMDANFKDFGLEGKWETTKDGKEEFVVTGAYSKEYNKVFKRYKGKFHDKQWHFIKPNKNIEQKIAAAIGRFDKAYLDTSFKFSEHITERIANTFKARGFLRHKIHRTEAVGKDVVLGFEPDPILNAIQYVMGIAGGTAKRMASAKMLRAFTGTDITWSDYRLTKPNAEYVDYIKMTKKRGISAKDQSTAYSAVKQYIVENLRNVEATDRFFGIFKSLAVLKYLGARVPSAIVNLTVLGTSGPGTMYSEANIPIHKTYRYITSAINAYGKYLFGDKSKLPAWQVELFDAIRKKGWHQAQFNKEAIGELQSTVGRGYTKLVEASMYMFGATEQANRVAMIAGTYFGLNQGKGGKLNIDHFELSKKVSDLANGRYGKETIPIVAQGKSYEKQVFKMFYVFTKFSHTYLQNMYKMGKEGTTAALQKDTVMAKRKLKALSYMMLSPTVFAGVAGVPGWKLMMLIIEKLFGGDDPEEALYETLEENFGETVENVARFGVLGAGEHGITFKHSLAIDLTEVPTTILEFGGAPISVVTDMVKGVNELRQGHYGRFMEHALPSFAGRPFKAHREYTEGVRTRTGSKVFVGRKQIKADETDTFFTALGFSATRIAKLKGKRWHKIRMRAKYTKMRGVVTELYKDYMTLPPRQRTKKMYAEIQKAKLEYNKRVIRKKLSSKVPKITNEYLNRVWQRSINPTSADIAWQ